MDDSPRQTREKRKGIQYCCRNTEVVRGSMAEISHGREAFSLRSSTSTAFMCALGQGRMAYVTADVESRGRAGNIPPNVNCAVGGRT